MRKVILGLAVSLDGFIEGPKGEYDWCLSPPKKKMSEFINRIDAVFMGRKTYEMSLGMKGAGGGMPPMEEFIFSTTLGSVKKVMLITGDLTKEVNKIRQDKGKDIWLFGGAGLIGSLVNLKLVDEINLSIHPILLGGGKPLFSNIKNRINLELFDFNNYPSGLVTVKYRLTKKHK